MQLAMHTSRPKDPHQKYFDYLAEREGLTVLDVGHGLALYRHEPNGLIYLHTVYVDEAYRKLGIGAHIAAVLLEESENGLTTTVAPQANGSSESLLACLHTGFKVTHSDANLIYLYKPKGT